MQNLVYLNKIVTKRCELHVLLAFTGFCLVLFLLMTIHARHNTHGSNQISSARQFAGQDALLFPQETLLKANERHLNTPSFFNLTPNSSIILALPSSENIPQIIYRTIESILLYNSHRHLLIHTPISPINPQIGYRYISHLFDKYTLYGYNISVKIVKSPLFEAIEAVFEHGGVYFQFPLLNLQSYDFQALFNIINKHQALYYYNNASLIMAFGQHHPVLACIKKSGFTMDLLTSTTNECFTITNTINLALTFDFSILAVNSSYQNIDLEHNKKLFLDNSQKHLSRAYSWINYTSWVRSRHSPLNSRCSTFASSIHDNSSLLHHQQFQTQEDPDLGEQCSLSLVLPGFMKSGSTYLFDLLLTHPLLMRPLVGAKRKEACCYLQHPLSVASRAHKNASDRHVSYKNSDVENSFASSAYSHRQDCYPHIQPRHDTLFTVDGCVDYIHTTHLPQQLLADDPEKKLKVVIAVRDPIERLQSQHRFLYPTLRKESHAGNINLAMLEVLSSNITKELFQLATQALHHKNNHYKRVLLSRKLWRLLTHKNNAGRTAATWFDLLRRSLYFPFIDHWRRFVPKERLKLVFTARLQPHFLSDQELLLSVSGSNTNNDTTANSIFIAWKEDTSPNKKNPARMKMEQDYLHREMNSLFRFLDLPQMVTSSFLSFQRLTIDKYETDKARVPPQHRLKLEVKHQLKIFFRPFNDLLQELVLEI